jgi:4-hydroxythreonine-4-phosphate dehydrogenase
MRIAIACGDPGGVGPEVTLKALAAISAETSISWRLLGDPDQLLRLNASLRTGLPLEVGGDGRFVVDGAGVGGLAGTPGVGSPEGARASMAWLEAGARACLDGRANALVTAPVSKSSIIDAGYSSFVGQTEHLSAMAGTDRTIMMLLGADDRGRWLRVSLATIHVPLRRVADLLRADRIELAIGRSAEACRLLGLPRARVAVCGLNPHAGEGGRIGTEESTLIAPAIEAARRKGCDVHGPLPADTLFHLAYRGEFDAVVAMYHDQGLGPLKMVAFDSGVNWTLGLPFIRTSPDHGTAFDIAGRGVAREGSMVEAIRLAGRIGNGNWRSLGG